MNARNGRILTALLLAFAIGCGGGGGGEDNAAPTATIVFPPEVGLTDAATITVRGTAADDSSIASVMVGGVNATSNDGFRTWVAANVPLIAGVNVLQVEVTDESGNTDNDADRSMITRGAATGSTGNGTVKFRDPQDVALDLVNGRAIVVDLILRAVLSVDLATGDRAIISDDTAGTGAAFSAPIGLVMFGANVLVSDIDNGNIVEVDLSTGNRREFAASNASNPELDLVVGIAMDAFNGELLVVSAEGNGRLIAIDLAAPDNSWRIVTEFSGSQLILPSKIVLDGKGVGALVTNRVSNGSLIRVDLVNGDQTVVSSASIGTGTPQLFEFPKAVALESVNTALVPIGGFDEALVRVNLTTGDRTIVADFNTGAGPVFRRVQGMTYNPATRIAYVSDIIVDALFAVDVDSGDRVILSR